MRKCLRWKSLSSVLRAQEVVARKRYGPSALLGPEEKETLKDLKLCYLYGFSNLYRSSCYSKDGICGEYQDRCYWRPEVTDRRQKWLPFLKCKSNQRHAILKCCRCWIRQKNEHRNQAKYFPPIKSYYKNFFLIHHRMLDSHNEAYFKMSLAKLLDF